MELHLQNNLSNRFWFLSQCLGHGAALFQSSLFTQLCQTSLHFKAVG